MDGRRFIVQLVQASQKQFKFSSIEALIQTPSYTRRSLEITEERLAKWPRDEATTHSRT
jgi:hypothetical protein